MKILITGICGFVGSRLAASIQERLPEVSIVGIDNLVRPGSESNRAKLASQGIRFFHGDIRQPSDVEALPECDWVVDAAANPSVLAGIDGRSSVRQVSEHNLLGTLNMLEYCRVHKAGFLMLSTSRVYSIRDLAALPMRSAGNGFVLDCSVKDKVAGVSPAGISETFPTRPPISLYGATKLASETMAVEYGQTFGFPVWVNRCGVLAGAGQFGTAEQGIFSYWLHAHAARRPLRYIGFGGLGHQVRDAFHPDDLADLLLMQMKGDPEPDPIYNIGGGAANSMSLAQLTEWCDARFGRHQPEPDFRPRPFDIPWVIMDSGRVWERFGWKPQRTLFSILDDIAAHAEANPDWLTRSQAV